MISVELIFIAMEGRYAIVQFVSSEPNTQKYLGCVLGKHKGERLFYFSKDGNKREFSD
jgi:hypothetical protein